MASHSRSASAISGSYGHGAAASTREKTHFEIQREALIGEIAMSFEHVLANINKLNRSLEAVVAVGNEFSSVEALWSQFENVMAKDEESKTGSGNEEQEEVGERSTTPKGEPGQQH
ncbi:DASH complex subunit Dad1-domain-containing protein [Xylaria scruposa]|nr:DASH complex subunit Dad1-domain-containing protein [Xylaria scruposa]